MLQGIISPLDGFGRGGPFGSQVTSVTPVLNSITMTPVDGGSTATIAISFDALTVLDGSTFIVVLPDTSPAPSAAQIVAGTDGANDIAPWSDSVAFASLGAYTGPAEDLFQDSDYIAYATHRSASGRLSNVVFDAFTTTDELPVISGLTAQSTGPTTGEFEFDIDDPACTVYWSITVEGADPDKAAIIAGTGALDYDDMVITSAGHKSDTFSGLTADTDYELNIFARDGVGEVVTPITSRVTDGENTNLTNLGGTGTTVAFTANQSDNDGGSDAALITISTQTGTGTSAFLTSSITVHDGINELRARFKESAGTQWVKISFTGLTDGGTAYDTNNTGVWFRPSTGAVGATPGNKIYGTPTVISEGNGWYELNVRWDLSGMTTDFATPIEFRFASADNATSATRNGTSAYFIHDILFGSVAVADVDSEIQRYAFATTFALYGFSLVPEVSGTTASVNLSYAASAISDGTFFIVVLPFAATAPAAADIEAGTDGDDIPATWAAESGDGIPYASIDTVSLGAEDMSPGTNYTAYAVHKSTGGSYSNIVEYDFTTPGTPISAAELLQENFGTVTNGLWFSGVDGSLVIANAGDPTDDYNGTSFGSKFSVTGTLTPSANGITIDGSNYLSILGTLFPRNNDAVTLLFDITPTNADSGVSDEYTILSYYAATNRYLRVLCDTASTRTGELDVALRSPTGGTTATNYSDTKLAGSARRKIAISISIDGSSTTIKSSVDGGAIETWTSGALVSPGPDASGTWHICHGGLTGVAGSRPINGYLRSLVILPEVLTEAELQAWGA